MSILTHKLRNNQLIGPNVALFTARFRCNLPFAHIVSCSFLFGFILTAVVDKFRLMASFCVVARTEIDTGESKQGTTHTTDKRSLLTDAQYGSEGSTTRRAGYN